MSEDKPNLTQMLALIETVFATKNNPDQIQVSPEQMQKLQQLHPNTLTELADENGPQIWVLIIPTQKKIMQDFLSGEISEKDLLEFTEIGQKYDCIYLCSATTLPAYRGKGKTKKICLEAIESICKDNPIESLFVWPFTEEGNALAKAVAEASGLKLYSKANL